MITMDSWLGNVDMRSASVPMSLHELWHLAIVLHTWNSGAFPDNRWRSGRRSTAYALPSVLQPECMHETYVSSVRPMACHRGAAQSDAAQFHELLETPGVCRHEVASKLDFDVFPWKSRWRTGLRRFRERRIRRSRPLLRLQTQSAEVQYQARLATGDNVPIPAVLVRGLGQQDSHEPEWNSDSADVGCSYVKVKCSDTARWLCSAMDGQR